MTALDLTQHPPRPCRFELGGIIFLARAIDKVRGGLPGGNMGAYINLHPSLPTMSGLFYRRLGITHDEFTAVVADAQNDDAVVSWLRARVDPTAVKKFIRQCVALRLADLTPESISAVREFYPAAEAADQGMLMIDLIDADDAAMFA